MGRKEFQGDEAVELGVAGFVDYTHSTLTKFFQDLVVKHFRSDHNALLLLLPPEEGGILKTSSTRPEEIVTRGKFWDIPPSPSFSRIL
jgi:hypothetical protein